MENKIKVYGNIYGAGVYYLETENEKKVLYVGSSQEMNDCLQRHLYYLKRTLYTRTNKEILQKEYDIENLVFRVVIYDNTLNDEELSRLEQQHIKLNRSTICNAQNSVTRHSSNKSELSTYKRKKVNRGSNNPNCKYDEKIIAEILWLKMNGYKAKEIEKFYKDIKANYIGALGVTKWIHLEPRMPEFIKKETAQIDAVQENIFN